MVPKSWKSLTGASLDYTRMPTLEELALRATAKLYKRIPGVRPSLIGVQEPPTKADRWGE
jgi:hypothetical protein